VVPEPTTITITSGDITADIAPTDGGRLAQLTVAGMPLLVGWSPGAEPTGWGSYPMVPWAGRIRHGRFEFDGVEHHLPINFGDHAIHGVGFSSVWAIEEHAARTVALRLELPTDERWPFGGMTEQHFTVDDEALTMDITVTASNQSLPYSFGWHPWFRKPSALRFHPTAMYRRVDEVAVDDLVAVPGGPWDDCFVNTEPVEAEIDGVALRLTSDCDHWVVYDERDYATCIEPQTGPPDAFNIAVRVLEPGESVSAWYRIERVG
jgi:aldose 1-epimerase